MAPVLRPRDAKRKAITATSTTQNSKRKAIEAISASQIPKRQKTTKKKAFRFLDLPAELRLQVYEEVAGNEDPAIELQSLLRVSKLVNNEVSGDLPKFATNFLARLENILNKQDLSRWVDGELFTLNGFKVLLQGSSTKEDVGTITMSLPISKFTTDGWIQAANIPFCHASRSMLFKDALAALFRLRRKQININFYKDVNDAAPQPLNVGAVRDACYKIEQVFEEDGVRILETVFDLDHTHGYDLDENEVRGIPSYLRPRIFRHRSRLSVEQNQIVWHPDKRFNGMKGWRTFIWGRSTLIKP
jgi:hypothetical protein